MKNRERGFLNVMCVLWYFVLCALPLAAAADSDLDLLRRDVRALLTPANAAWGALALGAVGVAHTFDDRFDGRVDNRAIEPLLHVGNFYAGTVHSLAGAVALRLAAPLAQSPELAGVSSELLRGLVLANAVVTPLKLGVNRVRPDGSNRYSFPSGHAANAFVIAAVLARRYGKKVGIPVYVLSAFVPVARIHDNHHFFSDVVAGAALGTLTGFVVTRRAAATHVSVVPLRFVRGWGLCVRWSR